MSKNPTHYVNEEQILYGWGLMVDDMGNQISKELFFWINSNWDRIHMKILKHPLPQFSWCLFHAIRFDDSIQLINDVVGKQLPHKWLHTFDYLARHVATCLEKFHALGAKGTGNFMYTLFLQAWKFIEWHKNRFCFK